MAQLLPVFRAARLVGVSRGTLQKKIHNGELETFEGMIDVQDLLRLYPNTELRHDTEFERVQNIKAKAFAKRVRERLLPDADVLAMRVSELGRELAITRGHLTQYQDILDQVVARLRDTRNALTQEAINELLHDIKITLSSLPPTSLPARELQVQDTVLRVMAAHIKIQPSNHEFWLEGSDTLLDAGIRSGLSLNYGCASGNCGLCKARIVSGEVKKIRHHDYVLSEAEKNMNYILLCSCTAVSDLIIEALEASSEEDIPLQEIVTKVKSINRPSPDMLILHVQTPRVQRLRFLAGQSVTLSLPDGDAAEFPIASCPCDDRNLLFHVPRDAEHPLINTLYETTAKGDEITVLGPHGSFLLQEDSPRALVFLAYGAGFAPIKSLIEHAMAQEKPVTMTLYWAVDDVSALYSHNLCRSWADALEDFFYQPVVKEDAPQKLLAEHADLDAVDVYVAGPSEAVTQAGKRLLAAGLPPAQLITSNDK
jgi:CDP-4-dehydro-6-deoxyglucose reductase